MKCDPISGPADCGERLRGEACQLLLVVVVDGEDCQLLELLGSQGGGKEGGGRERVCRRFVRKTYCQMFFRHIVRS